MYTVNREDPESPVAASLMDALSETLARITGDSGKSSFDPGDVRGERARFVVARTTAGVPAGCGAFRPLEASVAEVKRMYAVPGMSGAGSAVLAHLEAEAQALGYSELWLETRLVNVRAVAFYERNGYARISNFGKYVGNIEAACFAKLLSAAGV
ncbi:GNAT family N-acetyltransferase [Piscinibacter gummiphilus]|uniref:Acetyltransferase n=1 Tax=Piscinibacter gummiphilus TaxID=946333 RepID=A0A1W6LDF5_9BURK|nr:GNAT family N-acetyltransferase [Piscinibacter gummiphilus]ARN22294.1 acetyltransferase [Piscinibacter gummiphilus]ATU66983.1 N-acetyltransferase [Piscinibacter gummiphilus]GLS94403.1 N-acetyltransferase [Piscinibacter gummiphilus]